MKRRPFRAPFCIGAPVLVLLAVGCSGARELPAQTALQHPQCENLDAGLTRVDFHGLAAIRGSRLVTTPPAVDAAPREAAASGDVLLVALSRGAQPTPGYALRLQRVTRRGSEALIEVEWTAPEPGMFQAQVMTHPCLVIGLPAEGITHVRARDQTGALLGELAPSPP